MVWAFIAPALLLALAIPLLMGKGGGLIAGYNTMSREEKERYDAPALCRFIGKMCLVLCFATLLWGISFLSSVPNWVHSVGMVIFFAAIIFTLIYANTGNRFKK